MLGDIYYWIIDRIFNCSINTTYSNVNQFDILKPVETKSYFETWDTIKYSTSISQNKNSSVYLHNNYIYKVVDFNNYNELYKYYITIKQLEPNNNILYPLVKRNSIKLKMLYLYFLQSTY